MFDISHAIHGTGIVTYIYHKDQPNGMGFDLIDPHFEDFGLLVLETRHNRNGALVRFGMTRGVTCSQTPTHPRKNKKRCDFKRKW